MWHSKEEMAENLPLINHGWVKLHSFALLFLTCLDVAGVDQEELMQCVNIYEPMKKLHTALGGTEDFSQPAVAADLVQIKEHLLAELHVSLQVKETPISVISDGFRWFQIESEQLLNCFQPHLLTEPFHTFFFHETPICFSRGVSTSSWLSFFFWLHSLQTTWWDTYTQYDIPLQEVFSMVWISWAHVFWKNEQKRLQEVALMMELFHQGCWPWGMLSHA